VVADAATYALLGTRLDLDFDASTLHAGGRFGTAMAGSDGRWLEGELGFATGRRIGSAGVRADLSGFGLAYMEPYEYHAGGVDLRGRVALPTGGLSVTALPVLALGRWSTETMEGDLGMAGGDLDVARTAGALTTALSAGALHVDNGVTTGTFVRGEARARYDVGRWAGVARITSQKTPIESEVGGTVTVVGAVAPGVQLTLQAGRSLRDPLFGAAGTVVFAAGVSFRPVHTRALAPPPVAEVGGPEGPGRVVRFTLRAPGAETVELAGDFTGWEPVSMEPGSDGWQLVRVLPPGLHHFGFFVDGSWAIPPDAPGIVEDGWGRRNASIVIEP
jgi:hypothetical protein